MPPSIAPWRPWLALVAASSAACGLEQGADDEASARFAAPFFCIPPSDPAALADAPWELPSDRQRILEAHLGARITAAQAGPQGREPPYMIDAGLESLVGELAMTGAFGEASAPATLSFSIEQWQGGGTRGSITLQEPATSRTVAIDFADTYAFAGPISVAIERVAVSDLSTGVERPPYTCVPRFADFCDPALQALVTSHVQSWIAASEPASRIRPAGAGALFDELLARGAVGGTFFENRFFLDREERFITLAIKDGFAPVHRRVVLRWDSWDGLRLVGVERRIAGVSSSCPGFPGA